MLNLDVQVEKVILFSKNALLPLLIMGSFLVYFFFISDFSDEEHQTMHLLFIIFSILSFGCAVFWHIPSMAISGAVIYTSYLIINSMRYIYGEDYMFSAGYNIWTILAIPNLLIGYLCYPTKKTYKAWCYFFIFLLIETAIIERLQNQNVDADSYYFYRHIGMLNYPTLYLSVACLLFLIFRQIFKGKILNASVLFSSLSVFIAIYYSDNIFAFTLFFLSAIIITLVSEIYYTYYISYKDEELDIPNVFCFLKDAAKKYPLKYSVNVMYIDEYERLLKRFGENKIIILKKMFIARIQKTNPNILIYNYKKDSLILVFKNKNVSDSFEEADEIRRLMAKSIFVFNENNHLQLTVSQCVSEFKRSDAGAEIVLNRAEENLQKACKFTRNITVKV